jgi:transposase
VGCRLLGTLFGVDGELLERQYRNHLSGYLCWEQLPHAEEWLLFEKNIGAYVGLDEVCLSRGELYTVLINKERKGRSGSLIAVVKGTDVKTVTSVLLRLSRRRRFQVREITMDMAPNMEQIARLCFPAARRVTDRFHVQKLAYEAVQDMRVKARWEALDEESVQIAHAKACGKIYHAPVFENGDSRKQLLSRSIYLLYKKESLWTESQRVRAGILFREYPDIKKAYYLSMRLGLIYHAPVFENGDSRKQLLSRSIYLLYKKESLWTESQRVRAGILFREYPDIKKAYYLSMRLGLIYHQCRYKDAALTRLARWYDEVEKSGFLAFGRVARSVQMHYREIINFFDRGSTNAASESFNAKIKEFRTQFRGVKDRAFFLFRLAKIYA